MDSHEIRTHSPGGDHAHAPDHVHMHHHHHHHHNDATPITTAAMADKGDTTMMAMEMNMDMHHMMASFFTTKTHGSVLFEHVKIDNISGIAMSMVVVVLACLLFETLNYSLNKQSTSSKTKTWTVYRLLLHSLSSIMKMMSVLLGYLIMLCVMTYNIWILISVVLGFGMAHLVVRPLLLTYFSSDTQTDIIQVPSNNTSSTRQELLCDNTTSLINVNTVDTKKGDMPVRYKKIGDHSETVSLVFQPKDV